MDEDTITVPVIPTQAERYICHECAYDSTESGMCPNCNVPLKADFEEVAGEREKDEEDNETDDDGVEHLEALRDDELKDTDSEVVDPTDDGFTTQADDAF